MSNKISMTKKITIETLAEITANEFRTVSKRFDALEGKVDTLQSTMKEGFGIVLDELRGVRDDVKQARGASSVEYAQLREKVEALEEDVRKIKRKVKV